MSEHRGEERVRSEGNPQVDACAQRHGRSRLVSAPPVAPAEPPGGRFHVGVEPALGGRWTSLCDRSGREWLWHRVEPARADVRPWAPFVDAGGVEECFPGIRGTPDHGDVWSRPWRAVGDRLTVDSGPCTLGRRIDVGSCVEVEYELTGPSGFPFVWAFHALLEPDPGLRIEVEPGPCRCWPGAAVDPILTSWPAVLGDPGFAVLGPDDGSAAFVIAPDRAEVVVVRGGSRLRMVLTCAGQPVSIGIWRNLGGYPGFGDDPGAVPYRSLGVEPMLGRRPDVGDRPGTDVARIPASGRLAWRLVIDDL